MGELKQRYALGWLVVGRGGGWEPTKSLNHGTPGPGGQGSRQEGAAKSKVVSEEEAHAGVGNCPIRVIKYSNFAQTKM